MEEPLDERRTRNALLLAAAVAILGLMAAVYIVYRTTRDLADTDDAAGIGTALSRLLLISALSGVIACLTLEFAKRVGQVRRVYHRGRVDKWFGSAWRDGTAPIDLGASLETVTAQLVVRFRDNPTAVGGLAGPAMHKVPFSPDGSAYDLAIDRWMDSFHVATRSGWVRSMRLSACVIAAILAGFGAAAADSDPSVIVGLCAAGLIIGGPVAWTLRDLVRLIERRATTP